MYLRDEELRLEFRVTTVSTKQFKSAHKEVQIAWLNQQIRFYISFTFVNTIR